MTAIPLDDDLALQLIDLNLSFKNTRPNEVNIAYINENRTLKWVALTKGYITPNDYNLPEKKLLWYHQFDEPAFIIAFSTNDGDFMMNENAHSQFHPLESLMMSHGFLGHSVFHIDVAFNNIEIQDFRKKGDYIAFVQD